MGARKAQQRQVNQRIAELLEQGLTTQQIRLRLGVQHRRVIRIKENLKRVSA